MSSRHRTLLSRLHQAEGLSVGHRKLAELLLGHPLEAPFWGIEEVALKSGTSTSAVVRFAKRLGYTGFTELKRDLVAEMQLRSHGEGRLVTAPHGILATLAEVATRDIQNLERLTHLMDETELTAVVNLLGRARSRVLIGHGVSWVMATQLGYVLTMAGLTTVAGNPAEFARQVANLGPKDVLVAFSFPPYSQETLNVASFAKSRKIPVIAITDRRESPLGKSATHALAVPGESLFFSQSLAAFNALTHTLATTLANRNPTGIIDRLREAEKVSEDLFTKDWKS
ncbi:MAG: MurR/RpiR family transcriptional regulator [Holophaga sp.]|nr:MurR/RpiR family transcriptional regulator [Holophaga sp.]